MVHIMSHLSKLGTNKYAFPYPGGGGSLPSEGDLPSGGGGGGMPSEGDLPAQWYCGKTDLLVDRQTSAKTLPSCNFVCGR